ncbi:unnamed protein product, partial [Prunus brigantina]
MKLDMSSSNLESLGFVGCLIERFQSMRNAIFLLICWDLDRIK